MVAHVSSTNRVEESLVKGQSAGGQGAGGQGADVVEWEGSEYLSLGIPLSSVMFIDQRERLQHCWEAIAKVGGAEGGGAGWKFILL